MGVGSLVDGDGERSLFFRGRSHQDHKGPAVGKENNFWTHTSVTSLTAKRFRGRRETEARLTKYKTKKPAGR